MTTTAPGGSAAEAPSDGGASDSASSSTSDAGSGEPRSFAGKVVLHCGDSMVGGQAGLTRALEAKFKAAGAKRFISDSWVSASISTFDQQAKFRELLARHKPDIVIVTLGANDVFVPHPDTLAPHVKGIVKRMSAGERECLWVSPPTWKKDTGVVEVIRDNVSPCKFFDARDMNIARAGDHIHPTDKGGAEWAEQVWAAHFAK